MIMHVCVWGGGYLGLPLSASHPGKNYYKPYFLLSAQHNTSVPSVGRGKMINMSALFCLSTMQLIGKEFVEWMFCLVIQHYLTKSVPLPFPLAVMVISSFSSNCESNNIITESRLYKSYFVNYHSKVLHWPSLIVHPYRLQCYRAKMVRI